jgi:hypothetical protein
LSDSLQLEASAQTALFRCLSLAALLLRDTLPQIALLCQGDSSKLPLRTIVMRIGGDVKPAVHLNLQDDVFMKSYGYAGTGGNCLHHNISEFLSVPRHPQTVRATKNPQRTRQEPDSLVHHLEPG